MFSKLFSTAVRRGSIFLLALNPGVGFAVAADPSRPGVLSLDGAWLFHLAPDGVATETFAQFHDSSAYGLFF